jgi:DNA-binding GntR family transcriptional regulator
MDCALEDDGSDTPLEHRTMQTIVTDRLRAAILNGQLAPGARLRQDDLAARLGVGRMPIREALLILKSEGLIEHRPHRGAMVVNLRPDDIREIFSIRSLLEGRAASLAAPVLTVSDLARLRRVHAEMTHLDHDVERWLALNHEFHTTIYTASGWPRLQAMINALRNTVQPYLRVTFSLIGRAAQQEHHRILQAAEEHDAEALERLTIEHLNRTAAELMAYLPCSMASQRGSGRPSGGATTRLEADAIARSTA